MKEIIVTMFHHVKRTTVLAAAIIALSTSAYAADSKGGDKGGEQGKDKGAQSQDNDCAVGSSTDTKNTNCTTDTEAK